MNASASSQKTWRTFHRKILERNKESKWGTPCKPLWIKHPWNASHTSYSELTRTLFLIESKRRWMHSGRNTTYECFCWFSQSLFYKVLNVVSEGVFKKMFYGEVIFHLKRMLKRLSYYKWRHDKNYYEIQG